VTLAINRSFPLPLEGNHIDFRAEAFNALRWPVGARVFRFDCRYRTPALGFKIPVLLHVSCFAIPHRNCRFGRLAEAFKT
jgi:hypothetical protein